MYDMKKIPSIIFFFVRNFSSEYEFDIFRFVNVKANSNFGIHKTKKKPCDGANGNVLSNDIDAIEKQH